MDKGDSTANIKEEELVVDDDGNAYESLPELFHGFHHNVVKQNNNTTEESLLLLSPLQQAELEQKEKEKDRITTDIQLPHNLLTETGSNLPNLTPPNSTSKRRKRSESVNPFPEFMEDEPIANHHVGPPENFKPFPSQNNVKSESKCNQMYRNNLLTCHCRSRTCAFSSHKIFPSVICHIVR